MTQKIYLDYAAATPVDPLVFKEMEPFYSVYFYNPSADYASARSVKVKINEARKKIAYWLGSQANEIVFTAGGTEANNLAIHGIMKQYPKSNMLISSIEHESIINSAKQYKYGEVKVKGDGRVDLESLKKQINDDTVLISIMYANNEIGTIEPMVKIADIIAKVKADRVQRSIDLPLIFHSDACQAVNFLDLHVHRLGVDLLTLNGGKIYGPKQSGALYISRNVKLSPIIYGGGQENNLRSGTENVPADIGLSVALDIAQLNRDEQIKQQQNLRDYFIAKLIKEIPDCVINGSLDYRLANNIHATFKGQDNEYLLIALDQAGVMAAAGSACSASKDESSHVLLALGLSDDDARSSLRFSIGKYTTSAEIDHTVALLARLIK